MHDVALARPDSAERQFYLEEGLKVSLVVLIVLGITKRFEQAGVIAGFAAMLTGLAERPGSLRERTFDLSLFAMLGVAPLILASQIGDHAEGLLALLFVLTAAFTALSRYGERVAHIGWVLTVWTTLVLGFRVWESNPASYIGYACGSLMVVCATIVPVIIWGTDLAVAADQSRLFTSRDEPLNRLISFALIKATAVSLAGLVGLHYFRANVFWVALTTTLMMPPTIKVHWNRMWHRAVGTVLGVIVGYGLVRFYGTNELVLQAVEIAAAFLLIASMKRKPYGLFVFFLTIFVVAQLGLHGIEIAKEGGIERIQATIAGIGIAITTSAILIAVCQTADSGPGPLEV